MMRLISSILFFGIIWSGIASAQKVILSNPTHRAKWPYENRYRFIVKDIPCSKITFDSDNGKFDQDGCELFYYPDTGGITIFRVYQKYANQLRFVESIQIQVDENKEPDVRLGTKAGGTISKAEVLAVGGLIARIYVNDEHADPVALVGYTILILHGDSALSIHNIGGRYSEKAQSLLANLQSNDHLIFAGIEAIKRPKMTLLAKPLEFQIE